MSAMHLEARMSAGRSRAPLHEAIGMVARRVIARSRERRAIRELRRMDNRILRDIGLSRSQIRAAVHGNLHRP